MEGRDSLVVGGEDLILAERPGLEENKHHSLTTRVLLPHDRSPTYLSFSAVRQKVLRCSVSVASTLLSAADQLLPSVLLGEGGRSAPGRSVASSSLVLPVRFFSLTCVTVDTV